MSISLSTLWRPPQRHDIDHAARREARKFHRQLTGTWAYTTVRAIGTLFRGRRFRGRAVLMIKKEDVGVNDADASFWPGLTTEIFDAYEQAYSEGGRGCRLRPLPRNGVSLHGSTTSGSATTGPTTVWKRAVV